jgi:hypothetical protein
MEQTHSGLGIASFIMSIAICALTFLVIVTAGVMEVTTPGGIGEVGTTLVGLLTIGCLFLDFIALGLGIGGLFKKDRKKVLSILGIAFSASTIFLTLTLIFIGLAS